MNLNLLTNSRKKNQYYVRMKKVITNSATLISISDESTRQFIMLNQVNNIKKKSNKNHRQINIADSLF